jgi:outer membrane receptor protein involved in Fe transport
VEAATIESQPASPSSPASTAQLKAVVVTAQRREETAQAVPTAISVVSGDSLVDSGVGRSAGEVLNSVPSASAATQLHGRPRWWIRGVGTGQQQLDFANPIGFYLPVPRASRFSTSTESRFCAARKERSGVRTLPAVQSAWFLDALLSIPTTAI